LNGVAANFTCKSGLAKLLQTGVAVEKLIQPKTLEKTLR
jgi:hypothetical protein